MSVLLCTICLFIHLCACDVNAGVNIWLRIFRNRLSSCIHDVMKLLHIAPPPNLQGAEEMLCCLLAL